MRHSGFRRKTRSVLSHKRPSGLSYLLTEYQIDDRVIININPAQVKGMPHRRFQGYVGVVTSINKRSIELDVQVGGKIKKVITRYEHIKPQKSGLATIKGE